MNISTEILHYTDGGTSDKVYIIETNKIKNDYIVTTSYGGREASILTSRIIYSGTCKYTAEHKADKVSREKRNKGYVEAARNLAITGYKPSSISITEVAVDNKQAATSIIRDAIPVKRKIQI